MSIRVIVDSFCCLRSPIGGARIRMEFPKVPWMPESLSGSVVWWWYAHNVCAVCACSLSVTCPVAMVNTIMC